MLKNIVPILIPLILLIVISSIATYKVLSGDLGNGESWRLACSLIGLTLLSGLSSFFIFRLLKGV